jgi:5-methylcytosine-specific restriction protein A
MPTITLMKKRSYSQTINKQQLHKWYNRSKWRKRRDAKVNEDPLCELCLLKDPPVTRPVAEVHHIIPIDIYNPDEALIYDWDNLQSLCAECHHAVHDRIRQQAHDERMKGK